MPFTDTSPSKPGSWLCADGPYQERITSLCERYPGLQQPDPENSAAPLTSRKVQVTLLTVNENSKYRREPPITLPTGLQRLKHKLQSREGSQNVWLVENINPEAVALLGAHFNMDPNFFLDYERVSKWARRADQPNLTPMLATDAASRLYSVTKYCELRRLDGIDSYCVSCADSGRFIHRMKRPNQNTHKNEFMTVSIIDRRVAYWHRTVGADGWDVVILCDPPLRRPHVWKPGKEGKDGTFDANLRAFERNEPFQGGFRDFTSPTTVSPHDCAYLTRNSLSEDISYYLLNLKALGITSPSLSPGHTDPLFILQKIIAAHYMQLMSFTTSHIRSLQRFLVRNDVLHDVEIDWVEARWSEIVDITLRCNEYIDNLEAMMLGFGISFEEPQPIRSNNCNNDISLDFQFILHQAQACKIRASELNGALTALTSMVSNAQAHDEARVSLREAKNVKALTIVAMLFIPLSFTSGLFSMNEQYMPGRNDFSTFWFVSVPLIIMVFAGAVVGEVGYGDDGKWGWGNFFHGLAQILSAWAKALRVCGKRCRDRARKGYLPAGEHTPNKEAIPGPAGVGSV
ncbi:hypothetical protein BDW02DRAFT_601608 [Decorospora gaudefroyi]|uniref:Cora-domain-containing protein n=1 Tax=Decorospora gaudefroyi TaxID=184978 RepID=A0A6A5K7R5_9PLEO|nr:hypothetical protein BDW02DRAFT_601608 [Decorospora gaudefroyi]